MRWHIYRSHMSFIEKGATHEYFFNIGIQLLCWQSSSGGNPCWNQDAHYIVLNLYDFHRVKQGALPCKLKRFVLLSALDCVMQVNACLCERYTPYEKTWNLFSWRSWFRFDEEGEQLVLVQFLIHQRRFSLRVWLSIQNHFTLWMKGSL